MSSNLLNNENNNFHQVVIRRIIKIKMINKKNNKKQIKLLNTERLEY